jgi:hypothetical protein
LLGGLKIKKLNNNRRRRIPPEGQSHLVSIILSCSSGGLLFLQVLGFETTQQRNPLKIKEVSHDQRGTLHQLCVYMSRDSPRMARIDHGPVTGEDRSRFRDSSRMTRFVTRQDGGTLRQVCVCMSRDSPRMARIDHGPVTRLG